MIAEEHVIFDLVVESKDLLVGKVERSERGAKFGNVLGIEEDAFVFQYIFQRSYEDWALDLNGLDA